MTESGGPVVTLDRVVKAYGGRRVVDALSFEVGRGEVFALLGPNGAGKTTTVEMIEGYRRPDDGRVTVLGSDPATAGRDLRARVGLMIQGGGGVDPRMTAREAIQLYGKFHREPRPTGELLALVGLVGVGRTRVRRLSGGERQRLGLALALVGRPEVAILDEPTAGMDVEGRAGFRSILAALRDDGMTVLLTSHDLTDVERVADRIAIIDHGRLVAIGSPVELSAGSPGGLRFRLDRALQAADVTGLGQRLAEFETGAAIVDDGNGRYRIVGLTPDAGLVAALATWCAAHGALIVELRTAAATLEERYLELVGAAERAALDDGEPAAAGPAA